jgi:hypothetical protein
MRGDRNKRKIGQAVRSLFNYSAKGQNRPQVKPADTMMARALDGSATLDPATWKDPDACPTGFSQAQHRQGLCNC